MQQTSPDSADFARFGAAMAATTLNIGPLPDLRAYRLVWNETCEGGTWSSRGTGADLMTFLKDPPEQCFKMPVCCTRFFGGHYAVLHWEAPTGLVPSERVE
ncbi:MAG: hypothetical protein MUE88_03770 [Flavobacteriales bacterium]|jgi:hypothetical protein|nr:hypothetical protein [Flavobacteriales bacterium]